MIKPISAKQFLMLGLCFLGFAVAQGIFLETAFVEANKLEAARLERPYDLKAREIEEMYNCPQGDGTVLNPNPDLDRSEPKPPDERCKEAKALRRQSDAVGSAPRLQAKEAENVLKVFGFGGSLGGLVML